MIYFFTSISNNNFKIGTIDSSTIKNKEYLAEGGFGKVYKAIWNGHQVVVKELHESTLEAKKILINEIKQLTKLKHPNIVEFYGSTNSKISMVMEFIDGGKILIITDI